MLSLWLLARDLQPTIANGGGQEEAYGVVAPSRVTFSSQEELSAKGRWRKDKLEVQRRGFTVGRWF